MKAPKRNAPGVLAALGAALQEFPDLRVGQLIENVFDDTPDFYYVEDDAFVKKIDDYVAALRNHPGRRPPAAAAAEQLRIATPVKDTDDLAANITMSPEAWEKLSPERRREMLKAGWVPPPVPPKKGRSQ